MAKSLLDTCAYIDFQRARKSRRQAWAVNTLRHIANNVAQEGRLSISTPTVMEIAHGLGPTALRAFREEVLPSFDVISFDGDAACLAGEIYASLETRRQRIGIPDTQVAAVAITRGMTLVTSNHKHFQRIIELGYVLKLENWREA